MRCHRVLGLFRALVTAWRMKFLALFLLGLVMSCLIILSIFPWLAIIGLPLERVSLGDTLLWVMLGWPTGLVAAWAAPWIFILAFSLIDIRSRGSGAVFYVHTGDRRGCWVACCAIVISRALLACTVLLGGSVFLIALSGGLPSLDTVSIALLSDGTIMAGAQAKDVLFFAVLLLVGAAALSLLQLALGVWVGNTPAFAVVAVLVLGSALSPLLPLPGAWLMAARVLPFAAARSPLMAPVPLGAGFVLFAVLGSVSVLVGGLGFLRCDLGLRIGVLR